MTEKKLSAVRKEVTGTIIRSVDDPYDRECFAWVDLKIDEGDIRRILVTQRYRQENRLYEGKVFTWKQWTSALAVLNMFSDVLDITMYMKNSGIDLNSKSSQD